MAKTNYSYKVMIAGRTVQRYQSPSIRRFKNHLATIKWQNADFNVYLKVRYGPGFQNEGIYENSHDLLFALDAFSDPAISKYIYLI
ncbi:MAG: hypothetical protein Q7S45_04620 [Candidatus Curtissbacteria bacterium]|nr:hypothetical protein [Candidatus Curtissbacteria bacterium]